VNWYRHASRKFERKLRSGVVIKPSAVEGLGAFPGSQVRGGGVVYPLIVTRKGVPMRTEAARMTNHQDDPSMDVVRTDSSLLGVARDDMGPDDECTVDYRKVMDLIREEPQLPACHIYRETPGVDDVVTDGESVTLQDQLKDIAEGRYR
jgi:hypothetical protein